MYEAPPHRYLVGDDGVDPDRAPTTPPPEGPDKEACRQRLTELTEVLHQQQRALAADGRYALLLIFQAMDAGGKDSTIRAVMSGINPAGCQVHNFAAPSPDELAHDFLWRSTRLLPARGMIGVFNRSYYEEVLIARVHPELIAKQKLPNLPAGEGLWQQRYESIRDHELHLARNGTVILKFWLHISPQEQRRRFLKRLHRPDKHWKFSPADIAERRHWQDYMRAYTAAVSATSRPWAPWYVIPADDKPYARLCVAQLLAQTLELLDLSYPALSPEQTQELEQARLALEREEQPTTHAARTNTAPSRRTDENR